MNGCNYTKKKFVVPTSEKVTQEDWDRIFKTAQTIVSSIRHSTRCLYSRSIVEHYKSLDSKELGEVNCG